jgi:hypothetical protein
VRTRATDSRKSSARRSRGGPPHGSLIWYHLPGTLRWVRRTGGPPHRRGRSVPRVPPGADHGRHHRCTRPHSG